LWFDLPITSIRVFSAPGCRKEKIPYLSKFNNPGDGVHHLDDVEHIDTEWFDIVPFRYQEFTISPVIFMLSGCEFMFGGFIIFPKVINIDEIDPKGLDFMKRANTRSVSYPGRMIWTSCSSFEEAEEIDIHHVQYV
jgi:hypothetical protein